MPVFKCNVSYDSFMKVEDVLRYVKKNALALNQYKAAKGFDNHFFRCDDVKKKIGEQLFRVMECDVVQYLFEVKN